MMVATVITNAPNKANFAVDALRGLVSGAVCEVPSLESSASGKPHVTSIPAEQSQSPDMGLNAGTLAPRTTVSSPPDTRPLAPVSANQTQLPATRSHAGHCKSRLRQSIGAGTSFPRSLFSREANLPLNPRPRLRALRAFAVNLAPAFLPIKANCPQPRATKLCLRQTKPIRLSAPACVDPTLNNTKRSQCSLVSNPQSLSPVPHPCQTNPISAAHQARHPPTPTKIPLTPPPSRAMIIPSKTLGF